MWGCAVGCEGHNQADDPNQLEIFHAIECHNWQQKGKEVGLGRLAICCLGTGWASIYPWEVVNDCLYITCFLFFLSSSTYTLLIKLFCFVVWFGFYLDPCVFLFLLVSLFPCPTEEVWGLMELLCVA